MALPRAGVNQVAAPFLPPAPSGLLLPGFLALYPAAAAVLRLPPPLASAPALFSWSLFSAAPGSASDSSGMWEGASFVHPLLLCSPGSASVPWFSSTRGLISPSSLSSPRRRSGTAVATSSPTRNRGASGSPGVKQTSPSTSGTAREEREHCCHLLCCLTSFSQIRSGRSKEMVNSAHEFVCFLSWKVQARQGRTFPHCGYIRF